MGFFPILFSFCDGMALNEHTRGNYMILRAGAGHGPCFQTRSGAPAEADLRQALDLLSARRVQLGERKKQAHQNADESTANPDAASRELVE